jgi:hypothetical protein
VEAAKLAEVEAAKLAEVEAAKLAEAAAAKLAEAAAVAAKGLSEEVATKAKLSVQTEPQSNVCS